MTNTGKLIDTAVKEFSNDYFNCVMSCGKECADLYFLGKIDGFIYGLEKMGLLSDRTAPHCRDELIATLGIEML